MVGLDENGKFRPVINKDMHVLLNHLMLRKVNDSVKKSGYLAQMVGNTEPNGFFVNNNHSKLDHSKVGRCSYF